MKGSIKLINGDCLDILPTIPDKSIDFILADPPYGTTACKWDMVIPFEKLWPELNRIIKPNAVTVLFGSEPFSSTMRMSNIKMYKYDWVWDRMNKFTGFQSAKYMPMRDHENISVFSNGKPIYYPQMREGSYRTRHTGKRNNETMNNINDTNPDYGREVSELYPKRIISFKAMKTNNNYHPTEKPVALLEYLIKTYTLEDETVLDFTMGSGSTGVACKNLNRKFIGVEKEKKYFDIAVERMKTIKESMSN